MRPDFDRAARMAYKTLLALHIDRLPIDPLFILMHCRNAQIHTYDDILARYESRDYYSFKYFFFDNAEAMTFRREYGPEVIYECFFDNRARAPRRRFTLAHELGHIILKHRMEERYEEMEADYYAAQLLAPRPVIDLMPDRTPEAIAHAFQISRTAAQIAAQPTRHSADPEQYKAIQSLFGTEVEQCPDRKNSA